MLEKFKAQQWHVQLILLVVIGLLLYTPFWYFITSDIRAETVELNTQVDQLTRKNQEGELAVEHIAEFRSLYASKSMEYDELKVLLPEEREITNVLQGLQDTASQSRLIVSRFSPREDILQDSMMAKPVEIEVDSNFNNLRAFFDKMAKLQRIVSVTDFKLNQLDKQSADRTLHAQFLLTAYYAAPEPAPGAPVPSGAPVPPGTTPPPAAPVAPPVAPPVAK
ncbi:MAG: type 4a pilus biogenesis protein PilO [Pyrinomonadaceae bacterium]|nr:type 4a pilus biogenesis protein PilO [Pyrinomonadaceae bacterium]